jgi:hypothetical protein
LGAHQIQRQLERVQEPRREVGGLLYVVRNPDTLEVYTESESELIAEAFAADLDAEVVPLEDE